MEQNFRSWIQESITVRFIIVSILVLLLLIPAALIRSVIREREQTRNEVVSEVSSIWANEQMLTGPILTIPFVVTYEEQGYLRTAKKYAHFLPANLTIRGNVMPEIRYRGIYEVVVYTSELSISGSFDRPDFSSWKISEDQILYDEASLSLGIADMRGIKDEIVFQFSGRQFEANPGLPTRDIMYSGVSTTVGRPEHDTIPFSFDLSLNGSGKLNFVPLGRKTDAHISANWQNPSFNGSFLPDERRVGKDGFEARWQILELNRNYPQKWINDEYNVMDSGFGVDFIFGVDHYQKAERSVKYAIMFLALTFLVIIFSELTHKKRVHPIQYLLIGIALCVFYTLLISLAEQIGFNWAYLVASAATTFLITTYIAGILKSRKLTLIVALSLIILYLFLFTLLQLQAYSLLMGSIGLFIVVGITMYLSRKINWYGSTGR